VKAKKSLFSGQPASNGHIFLDRQRVPTAMAQSATVLLLLALSACFLLTLASLESAPTVTKTYYISAQSQPQNETSLVATWTEGENATISEPAKMVKAEVATQLSADILTHWKIGAALLVIMICIT